MKLTKVKPSVDKVEEAKKWRHHKPKIEPQSTKQFERQLEKIKEDKKKKQLEEEKKIQEEEARKAKAKAFAPRVQHSDVLQKNIENF